MYYLMTVMLIPAISWYREKMDKYYSDCSSRYSLRPNAWSYEFLATMLFPEEIDTLKSSALDVFGKGKINVVLAKWFISFLVDEKP